METKGIEKNSVVELQHRLHVLFQNHLYDLYNSYVFDWECDYFSMTKSGYAYEVEIKLTKSDFRADFTKFKHEYFSRLGNKEDGFFKYIGKGEGSEICRYNTAFLDYYSRRYRDRRPERVEELETHEDILNGWKNFHLRRQIKIAYAPCSKIRRVNLSTIDIPNKFYFCSPEGIISPKDVPEYAGLIYPTGNTTATIIKEAPFIHKRKLDLNRVLKDKFYYEVIEYRMAARYEYIKKMEERALIERGEQER